MKDAFQCPHCGKPILVAKPPRKDDEKQTYLPAGDLDDALAEYAELLHITTSEGVILYQLKDYQPTDTWRKIDTIMSQHGGKYIKGGSKPGHWEVAT